MDGEDGSLDDVVRILVSTDNHLGYCERNGIRGEDSFLAFEEVLELSKQHRADMLLLGGDLFHDNKPSRSTLFRCMSLLRKHCLGEDAVAVRFASDPAVNFGPGENVNYMDPYLSVSLPIFSIHGNHDDPTGAANGPEQLSSIDLLHTAGLLNYFGKVRDNKCIALEPVLLQKGSTRIALYGLGNVRDERLYTTWKDERGVHWKRPKEEEGAGTRRGEEGLDAWFNIFVLHQNRAQRGTTKSVTEAMLPIWLDFVVWGHEHECRIDLEGGTDGPVVTQPGSTVATSLIEGEAKDVALAEMPGLHPAKPEGVERFLRQRVEELVRQAELESTALGDEIDDRLRQPLIRLRVDHSGGFEIVPPQRFGQQFVGRVANSADILLFQKRRAGATSRSHGASAAEGEAAEGEDEEVRVPDLVRHYLSKQSKLGILPVGGLNGAVDRFVSKAEPHAIDEYVEKLLSSTQRTILKDKQSAKSLEAGDIVAICEKLAISGETPHKSRDGDVQDDGNGNGAEEERRRGEKPDEDTNFDEEDDDAGAPRRSRERGAAKDAEQAAPTRKRRQSRAPDTSAAAAPSSGDEDQHDDNWDTAPPRGRGRPGGRSGTSRRAGGAVQASAVRRPTRGRQAKLQFSVPKDEDEVDLEEKGVDDIDTAEEDRPAAVATGSRRSNPRKRLVPGPTSPPATASQAPAAPLIRTSTRRRRNHQVHGSASVRSLYDIDEIEDDD